MPYFLIGTETEFTQTSYFVTAFDDESARVAVMNSRFITEGEEITRVQVADVDGNVALVGFGVKV